MAQITYDDKVDLNTTQVADINKVKASDMNEIKSVVNENYQELTNLITNDTGCLKLADGTLICYGKSNTSEIPYGSEYSETITLPESYKDNNFIVLTSITSGGASWANVICRGGATSENTITLIAGNYIVSGSTARSIVLGYITIGKWK